MNNIKSYLRDEGYFPMISPKETKDERDKRLSPLRNLMVNLAFCGDKKLFDWLWTQIKETSLKHRDKFRDFFEAEYIKGFEVRDKIILC
jgi:hypothetical protein